MVEAYLYAKFHFDPSNRLATVHERHRRTDRQTGHDRQRTDSIGRTVLQMVAQKRFALCYRTVLCPVCPVCLSVCNVGALWPNGWMDQDATWYEGSARRRPHSVRWGIRSPRKWAQQPLPLFGPRLLWPNGRPSQQPLSSCCKVAYDT